MNQTAISVSEDISTSVNTLNLAKKSSDIIPFIGIHPLSAQNTEIDKFTYLFDHVRLTQLGIGDIGLDRTYCKNESEYVRQRDVFEKMLSIAETHHNPVSVHSRASLNDVLDTLSSYNIPGVLLHWFYGDHKQLNRASDLGYYISFGPTLLYSKKIRKLAETAHMDLLLTETDGPVSYGACFEGKTAFPSFIPSVLMALSKIKGQFFYDVAEQVYENSQQYLTFNMNGVTTHPVRQSNT